MYLNEYYWDALNDKHNIATNSGFAKTEQALKSWFRKQHKVTLVNFVVNTHAGIPQTCEIQIEVPVNRIGIPPGLSWDEFVDLIEGTEEEKYNDVALGFIVDLFNADRILEGWDMQQTSDDPDVVVITYFLG